ncbi:MAG: DUF1684 domain-containing protein [Candidatus Kapaibacterium sp.]|nr:MAG: DUF1684 domain-containing protein [Candidatus Kapabacteria bacterium]
MHTTELLRKYCFLLGAFFILLLGSSACKKNEGNTAHSARNQYFQADSILAERTAKDRFWREGDTSPLPAKDKELFQGLSYFAPSQKLCVVARLELAPKPDTVQMQTSDNELRSMLRSGRAFFAIGKDSCALAVYRYTGIEGKMQQGYFIPFKDATNGTDTYRPGRYVEGIPLGAATMLLDFNRAYNPYCNYNEEYSCPLVPRENILQVKIEAGEKIYFHPRQ